ncbi:MAG: metal-dependent transcriptional regulator [Oscillospiraceae bacterium]|jgi:Mn-dependent DtxR family transcriptional regulator
MSEQFHTARGYEIIAKESREMSASLEDYMEMIYRIIKDSDFTRVNEIAVQLNVRPPSVSKMLSKLSALGLINYEKYGVITLTESGKSLGKYLLWRHNTIADFFEMLLGRGNKQAFVEAELSEHIFEAETVRRLEWIVKNLSEEIKAGYKNRNHKMEFLDDKAAVDADNLTGDKI